MRLTLTRMARRTLVKLLVCRHGPWNTPGRPARHDFQEQRGVEAPVFVCRRCDHVIGF